MISFRDIEWKDRLKIQYHQIFIYKEKKKHYQVLYTAQFFPYGLSVHFLIRLNIFYY